MERVSAWNARTVRDEHAPRPQPRSWSDKARLPWLQSRAMHFINGRCELLGAHGPTLDSAIHKAAFLAELKDFPNRQLLSFIEYGVRMGDDLAFNTTIAPNLFSLAEVVGGADAVAEEMHALKIRGWYASSAGTGAARGTAPPQPARLLASPIRICPRGAVPRKDGGPPRGVAEQEHPRQQELPRDAQTPVNSLNNASGDGNKLFPQKEIKPRIKDACVNICILDTLAESLGVAVLMLLFDYKYFFHQLVYDLRDGGDLEAGLRSAGKASRGRRAPGHARRVARICHVHGLDACEPHRTAASRRDCLDAAAARRQSPRGLRRGTKAPPPGVRQTMGEARGDTAR